MFYQSACLFFVLSLWSFVWRACIFVSVCFTAALLQEQWEGLALKLSQTQEQIRACESAMVFAFVEVIIRGHALIVCTYISAFPYVFR